MNEPLQHIVFLTPGFPESTKDSVTIPALQVFLKRLRQDLPNIRLTLLAFQFPFTTKPYLWHGINVIPLGGKNKRLKKIGLWLKASQTLINLHKTYPITNIHSFWIGECAMIGEWFSKKNTIKHIITVMGQDALPKNTYTRFLLNTKAKIITLSTNQHQTLLNNYNLNSTVIQWSIDTTSFPILQKSTIDILGVGSINSVKNYSNFIDVIALLVQKRPNLKVTIIGDGILLKKIKIKIKQLQLQHIINITGQLPRAEVLEKMAQSKILLHTSLYESFGFVFLEALYSGMYIVSYNVGIAAPSKHWQIGRTVKELALFCDNLLLNTEKSKSRIQPYNISSLIKDYLSLYNA